MDDHSSFNNMTLEGVDMKDESEQRSIPQMTSIMSAQSSDNGRNSPSDVHLDPALKTSVSTSNSQSTSFDQAQIKTNEYDHLFAQLLKILHAEVGKGTTDSAAMACNDGDAATSPQGDLTRDVNAIQLNDSDPEVLKSPNSPEKVNTTEANYSSQRSQELLRRATRVLGKASLTLSSCKELGRSSINMEELDDNDSLPRGKMLFHNKEENLDETTVSSRKVSFSPAATACVGEVAESVPKQSPGGRDCDGASTTITIATPEQDFNVAHVYMHAPYRGPNDHYPDPDIILSMISTESSSGAPMPFIVQERPWELGERRSTVHQFSEQESSRSHPKFFVPDRHTSQPWQHTDGGLDTKGKLERSKQKYGPFVGVGRHFNFSKRTSRHSEKTDGPARPHNMRKRRERWCFGNDSANVSDGFPSMSSISPGSSNDSCGSAKSSRDGLFRGNDSMSTLSFGTAFNSNRIIQWTNTVHSSESCRKTRASSHYQHKEVAVEAPFHTDEEERMNSHCYEVMVAREMSYRSKNNARTNPNNSHSLDRRDAFHSKEKKKGFHTYTTQQTWGKEVAARGPFGRKQRGGPGGTYIIDDETPRASCLGMLFSGSCASQSVKLDDKSQIQAVPLTYSDRAYCDYEPNSYSMASTSVPGGLRDLPSRSPEYRLYPGNEKSYTQGSSRSPRDVFDFPMINA